MKLQIMFFAAAALFASCKSAPDSTSGTDTVAASGDTFAKSENTKTTGNTPTVSSLCFMHTDGTGAHKDTTSIEFVIRGDKVSGQMNWLPYEKDSRKGKLDGEIKDGIINATWKFMQEGMTDTMNVAFRLAGDNLSQKPLKFDAKSGRQETDQSADYTVKYNSANKVHK